MSIIKVDSSNFSSEVLNASEVVLVDFYADWCGPCKMMGSVIDAAADTLPCKVVKLNVDNSQDIASQYRVMSIPTLIVFKDGKEVKRSVGAIPEAQIRSLVQL